MSYLWADKVSQLIICSALISFECTHLADFLKNALNTRFTINQAKCPWKSPSWCPFRRRKSQNWCEWLFFEPVDSIPRRKSFWSINAQVFNWSLAPFRIFQMRAKSMIYTGQKRGWNVNKLWLSSSIFRTTKVTLWYCRFYKPCSFLPFVVSSLKSIQLLRANQLPHSQLWTGTLYHVLEYKSNHVRRRRLSLYPICPTEESFFTGR